MRNRNRITMRNRMIREVRNERADLETETETETE
jgi:hypothetical protein